MVPLRRSHVSSAPFMTRSRCFRALWTASTNWTPRALSPIPQTALSRAWGGNGEAAVPLSKVWTASTASQVFSKLVSVITKGIKPFFLGLWGTTLTENTSNNRELFVRTTLRELLVYLVFLVDICLCKFFTHIFSKYFPYECLLLQLLASP